jgi:hypothetical protein
LGQIIAGNDTLGTPTAPLASGTTPVAQGGVMSNHLKRVGNDKQYECYPNHYGTILVDADRERNHCSEH